MSYQDYKEGRRAERFIADREILALRSQVRYLLTVNGDAKRQLATANTRSETRRRQLLEQATTINALQVSLDEANARIDALTPKQQPASTFTVRDTIEQLSSGRRYVVKKIHDNGRLDIRSIKTGIVLTNVYPAGYRNLSSEPPFKVGDTVRHEGSAKIYQIHDIRVHNGVLQAQFVGWLTGWSSDQGGWFPLTHYTKVS